MSKSRAKRNRDNSAPPAPRKAVNETATLHREPVLTILGEWFQSKLVRVPRLLRILLAGLFGLAITGAIFPLVDDIYVQYFFTQDTRIIPSYISAGIGAASYALGFYLIAGPSGENRVSSRPITAIYLLIGIAALCLDIFLIIQGIGMTDAISG